MIAIKNSQLGNCHWKKVKRRLFGENHQNWKGGVTHWKKRIYDSPKYKNWRKSIFERDNYTCQGCGIRSKKGLHVELEAHHLISFTELLRKYKTNTKEKADKCKELWKIELGQTLCNKCHNLTKNGKNTTPKRIY